MSARERSRRPATQEQEFEPAAGAPMPPGTYPLSEEPPLPAGELHPAALALMEPGETLLWTGRPAHGDAVSSIASSGATCGAAIGFLVGVLTLFSANFLSAAGVSLPEWAKSPALMLAYGSVGGLVLGAVAALGYLLWERMVIYAVSDRRAMRIPLLCPRGTRSYRDLDPLQVALEARADGSGDLIFTQDGIPAGSILNGRLAGFFGLRDAQRVERMLLATLLKRHAQPSHDGDTAAIRKAIRTGLRSRSPGRHAEAVASLLQLDDRAFEMVAGDLGDRLSGIRALGVVGIWRSLGTAGARAFLRGLDANATMRRATLQALSRLGRPAVVSLIRAWAAVRPESTPLAVEALRRIPDELLAGALADAMLADDPTAGVDVCEAVSCRRDLRRLVIDAWVSMEPDALAEAVGLRPRLWHNVTGARAAAAPARVGPRLPVVRGRAGGGGGRRGVCHNGPGGRAAAARDLGGRLLALVRGRAGQARYWAAEALGILAIGQIAERLRKDTAGADAGDFPTAILLAYLGDPAGLAILCTHLSLGGEACEVAAGALGRLGAAGAPALDAMERALRSETHEVARAELEHAVGRIRRALRSAPVELEAAGVPAGTGTELEAAGVPAGSGTEMEAIPVRTGARLAAAPSTAGRDVAPEARPNPEGRPAPGRRERGR